MNTFEKENTVLFRIQKFWTSHPYVSFAQAKFFHLQKAVADETMYFHIYSVLDQETTTSLLDLVSQPLEDDKYTRMFPSLKNWLIDTFNLSKQEQASLLLCFQPSGNFKPQALMHKMLILFGDHSPCLLFKQFFLVRSPKNIQIQLVDTKFDND